MSFGTKLAIYRIRTGLTQFTLALKIGVQAASISELERDKMKPRIETFARLTEALNLSPEETIDLLEEANQPAKDGR